MSLIAVSYCLEKDRQADVKEAFADFKNYPLSYPNLQERTEQLFERNVVLALIPMTAFTVVWICFICLLGYFFGKQNRMPVTYYLGTILTFFVVGVILVPTLCSLDIVWAYRIMAIF